MFFYNLCIIIITMILFLAVCTPECENGDCTGPNECKCYTGWKGDRCRQGKQSSTGTCIPYLTINK